MNQGQLSREELIQKFKNELDHGELLKNSLSSSSRFDLLLTIIKLEMPGTEKQKIQMLNKRVSRFFDYGGYSIDISKDHFCSRKQPKYNQPGTVPLKNQLVLFGVDFLSTRRIKLLFGEVEPKISWIDNSNCKLIFSSGEAARQGLNKIIDPQKQQFLKPSENLPTKWYQCKHYFQLTFKRILQCRFATSMQLQIESEPSPNYEAYKRARKSFQKNLLNDCNRSLKQYQRYFQQGPIPRRNTPNPDKFRSREKLKSHYNKQSHPKISHNSLNPQKYKKKQSRDMDQQSNYSFILHPEKSVISQGSILQRLENLNLNASLNFEQNQENDNLDLSFSRRQMQKNNDSMNKSFSYLQYVKKEQQKQKQERDMKRKANNEAIKNCADVILLDD